MSIQPRLPGTIAPPKIARESFQRAHKLWLEARKWLETAIQSATDARDLAEKLRAGEVAASDDYVVCGEAAEADVFARMMKARDAYGEAVEMQKNAQASRRDARKAEREAEQRRDRAFQELLASQKGER